MYADNYDFDYDRMANDADDMYDNDYYEDEDFSHDLEAEAEWENYYHNIADEISDE